MYFENTRTVLFLHKFNKTISIVQWRFQWKINKISVHFGIISIWEDWKINVRKLNKSFCCVADFVYSTHCFVLFCDCNILLNGISVRIRNKHLNRDIRASVHWAQALSLIGSEFSHVALIALAVLSTRWRARLGVGYAFGYCHSSLLLRIECIQEAKFNLKWKYGHGIVCNML